MIRSTGTKTDSIIINKSWKVIGYADDLNIVERNVLAVKETFMQLVEETRPVGLLVNEDENHIITMDNMNFNIWV